MKAGQSSRYVPMSSGASGGASVFVGRWLCTPVGQLQILLALSVVFGGGGAAYGLRNLMVQLAALVILWLQRERARAFLRDTPRLLVALTLMTLAVPLLQLVPLPPAIWQSLPGREPVVSAFALAGIPADSWFAFSLDRGRTLTAFCSLIPPVVILVVGASLEYADRVRIARFAVFAALAALLLGMIQLNSGNTSAMLFSMTAKSDVLYATFANRNSTAAFFALALLLLAGAPIAQSRAALLCATAGGALLALGVILTQSRSGMVLLVLALGIVLLRAGFAAFSRGSGGVFVPPPGWVAAAMAGVLVAGAVLGSVIVGGRGADTLARFGDTQTDRPEMWEDAAFAARAYWPLGSGMGTFDEVFQLHESLEYISPRRAGRAHSDVLEVVIEAGIVGAMLVIGWLVWCAQAALFAPAHRRWTALAAGAGVLALLLQSMLDYPLRSQTLLCIAALLVVLLVRRRAQAA